MIQKLFLSHFRNLQETQLDFQTGITLIVGNNGQGKTNLLEALHWVGEGWSFRTRESQQVIGWNENQCTLRLEGRTGKAETEMQWHQAIQFQRGQPARVRINQEDSRGLSSLFGPFPMLFMGPEDIALVKDGPEGRRRFLDLMLARRWPDGLEQLKHYRRILQQRNRWLKEHQGQNQVDSVFDVLTQQLCELGTSIIMRRVWLTQWIRPLVQEYYSQLSSAQERIDLNYKSFLSELNVQPEEQEDGSDHAFLTQAFQQKLLSMRRSELQYGFTAAGPHKDDLMLTFDHGRTFREAGSQGQCRSLALALGLAALDQSQQNQQTQPTLLLDDIFAELDANRRQALASLIRMRDCQVLAALPRSEDLPFAGDQIWHVDQGRILS